MVRNRHIITSVCAPRMIFTSHTMFDSHRILLIGLNDTDPWRPIFARVPACCTLPRAWTISNWARLDLRGRRLMSVRVRISESRVVVGLPLENLSLQDLDFDDYRDRRLEPFN
jgi:hypothetical protein